MNFLVTYQFDMLGRKHTGHVIVVGCQDEQHARETIEDDVFLKAAILTIEPDTLFSEKSYRHILAVKRGK